MTFGVSQIDLQLVPCVCRIGRAPRETLIPHTWFFSPIFAGFNGMRVAKSGNPLPSARAVSLAIFEESPDSKTPRPTSKVYTLIHMTLGQLIDHDITKTAITKIEGKLEKSLSHCTH